MMVPMYWVCLGQGQHHDSCGILAGWKDCGLCLQMVGGVQWGGVTVVETIPKQSLSDSKALCHDNSLAVMSTVAIEYVLLVVDWGLERQKACRLPVGMDTAHKWSAEVLWMMVPMYWVCLGKRPTSLLLWHFSRVERLWFVYRNGWGCSMGWIPTVSV